MDRLHTLVVEKLKDVMVHAGAPVEFQRNLPKPGGKHLPATFVRYQKEKLSKWAKDKGRAFQWDSLTGFATFAAFRNDNYFRLFREEDVHEAHVSSPPSPKRRRVEE